MCVFFFFFLDIFDTHSEKNSCILFRLDPDRDKKSINYKHIILGHLVNIKYLICSKKFAPLALLMCNFDLPKKGNTINQMHSLHTYTCTAKLYSMHQKCVEI